MLWYTVRKYITFFRGGYDPYFSYKQSPAQSTYDPLLFRYSHGHQPLVMQ